VKAKICDLYLFVLWIWLIHAGVIKI